MRQAARSLSLNFVQKIQAENHEWEMLIKVWTGGVVSVRLSSVASLEKWSWLRMLFLQNASSMGSLFSLPYLLPPPLHPFFSSLYFITTTTTPHLPYSVISELEMKGLSSVRVASRLTQSRTWFPCDLQDQLWNCKCLDAVPVLNWALVKLLAVVHC